MRLYGTIVCWLLSLYVLAHAGDRSLEAKGTVTDARFYHLQKSNGRWSFVDPDGHPVFMRAVSQVDTNDFGGQGNFQSYDAVYMQTSDVWSRNLAEAAKNALRADVVNAQRVTVSAPGDAIYLGSERFKPIATYFWLDRLGSGGAMKWYYSAGSGRWALINGSGNPFGGKDASAALDPEGGYSLDVGGYLEPDNNGFAEKRGPNANRVVWWRPQEGPPTDFAPTSLPNDQVARYYIKGIVVRPFAAGPVLNQVYERHQLIERIRVKYGLNGTNKSLIAWAEEIGDRFRAWGFNATGQYSYRYWQMAPSLSHPLPIEPTWQLSGYSMRPDFPYHVKNVYAGVVCPPGSHQLLYQGLQADVFDPAFSKSLSEEAAKNLAKLTAGPYSALIPEEADELFGLNSATTHPHLGYVVLAQNPYVASNAQKRGQQTDHTLYSKYALRDFLRQRYNGSIDALNRAWGTHYTTWDTSSGDLASGTNAWSSGTGLMDENGQHVYYPPGAPCRAGTQIQYNFAFTNPGLPSVRKDLDDFVEYFAQAYGKALSKAFAQGPHPLVFMPLYRGPLMAYKGVAPYVDGFWLTEDDPDRLKQIYVSTGRPVILADYSTANPDSPLFFRGTVSSLTYDPRANLTTVVATGMEYIFRAPWQVTFPDAGLASSACLALKGGLSPNPRIVAIRWNSFDLRGNYVSCIARGTHVELFNWVADKPDRPRSQSDRARYLVGRLKTALSLRGEDGNAFVVGFEHWDLYDNSPSDYGEIGNFGLITLEDNAYDGIEARRATGKDARGYERGGEERDYGDLLGPLGAYLRKLDELH